MHHLRLLSATYPGATPVLHSIYALLAFVQAVPGSAHWRQLGGTSFECWEHRLYRPSERSPGYLASACSRPRAFIRFPKVCWFAIPGSFTATVLRPFARDMASSM